MNQVCKYTMYSLIIYTLCGTKEILASDKGMLSDQGKKIILSTQEPKKKKTDHQLACDGNSEKQSCKCKRRPHGNNILYSDCDNLVMFLSSTTSTAKGVTYDAWQKMSQTEQDEKKKQWDLEEIDCTKEYLEKIASEEEELFGEYVEELDELENKDSNK